MTSSDTFLTSDDSAAGPRRIGLLLVSGFPLMSYASAVEPLRAANLLAGAELYQWRHISGGEAAVPASSGLSIRADHTIADTPELDAVLVCAGGNPAAFDSAPTLRWLRSLRRKRMAIGGVSGGPYLLARAGLLEGYRCTIHWEHAASFHEAFPRLRLMRTLYELDRDRMTCAGGVAALDMMMALITRQHGRALGRAVGDWFIQAREREGDLPQRSEPGARYGVSDPHLIAALRAMDARVETPLSRGELAQAAGVGIRQLERLFAQKLSLSVGAHYLALRLDRAKTLIDETSLPVLQVAMACGFASGSHFSRAFSARFGASPRKARSPTT